MAVRPGCVSSFIAAVLAAGLCASSGSAARLDGTPGALPTLYVAYTMNCTFSIVDDQGRKVSSIAPGTYQVEVSTPIMFKLVVPNGPSDQIAPNDFSGCKGWVQFQLTGPGVNLFTTLDLGCDAFYLLPATSFKANSTFTAQDLNQPGVTRTTFTTQASGSPTTPASPYTPTSGKGTPSQDIVGSDIKPALRGTLVGTLSAKGTPTLRSKGKSISVLRAGRYKFAITDQDPKASFVLQAVGGKPKELTAADFVGKHSVTVTLDAGRWMFSSGRAPYNYLLVTR
jgi:hypothetical protein